MEIIDQNKGDERMWAMFTHLSALAFFIIPAVGMVIGPLIIWLIKKDDYALVDEHGKMALNFNLSVLLYSFICGILTLFVIGIALGIALAVFWLAMVILASVKTNNGEPFTYPLSIQFIR